MLGLEVTLAVVQSYQIKKLKPTDSDSNSATVESGICLPTASLVPFQLHRAVDRGEGHPWG